MKANVLISKDGRACLCDFDLSRLLQVSSQSNYWALILIMPTHDKGPGPASLVNLRWTAPEVLSRGIVSKHSDVWSFGMVGLEILSNEVPFYGKDDEEVKRQLINGKHPDRPTSVAAHLSELPFEMKHSVLNSLLKCWAKVPDERPSMSNLSVTLESVRVRGINTAPVATGSATIDRLPSKLIDRNLMTGLSTKFSSAPSPVSALSTSGSSQLSSPIVEHDHKMTPPQGTDSHGIPLPPPSPEIQAAISNSEFTWKADEDGVVVAGTLEGLVQFLVITISERPYR